MSVNVQASLDHHGLTADEQLAVFAYMQRSQQVNAYEVQQHIANGTIKSFGQGILSEAEAKKKNEVARQKSAIELMADHEREKQAAKESRRAAKEAKKQSRLEREEFERTGGQVKLSKKERRKLEMMDE
ncbi:unnamed product [Ostreococcus tauri]|nr:unnamed product [Ostreococcus tauri]CEG01137.1 unnamed product [Ostreococcus tauri]|eukprot:XP_003075209.2 unnamed product [Ostreococcus tauri]